MKISRPPTSSDPAPPASTAEPRDAPEAAQDYWRDIGMHLGIAERDRAGQQLAAGHD